MFRSAVLAVFVVTAIGLPRTIAAQESKGAAAAKTVTATINLNTATASQLEMLPGIGPRTAERIIEYRQKHGGFKKIEELMNVQGIGEKGFLKLKPLVGITPPKTDRTGATGGL